MTIHSSVLVPVFCNLRGVAESDTTERLARKLVKDKRDHLMALARIRLLGGAYTIQVGLPCRLADCSPPGSSVRGIFQARILEWVAVSSSRGSSPPRNRTPISCIFWIGRQVLYRWVTWETLKNLPAMQILFTSLWQVTRDGKSLPAGTLPRTEVWAATKKRKRARGLDGERGVLQGGSGDLGF